MSRCAEKVADEVGHVTGQLSMGVLKFYNERWRGSGGNVHISHLVMSSLSCFAILLNISCACADNVMFDDDGNDDHP